MAYESPGVDAHGVHFPDYQDILQRLTARFKEIFGDDLYLGQDTQDYQMIAEFADLMDDIGLLCADVYNAQNPDFATGVSLDYILSMNGIRRLNATYSVVELTLGGSVGTLVPAGSIALDVNGNQWRTNENATIGSDAQVTVTATCTTIGRINAEAGSINQILSPTAGWITVNNASAAVAGRNAETDAEVRARRIQSLSAGSTSMVESLTGALLGVPDVTKAYVYENATGSTDANSVPAHSICAIVKGGDGSAIAQTVFQKKSPGCGTYGSSSGTVVDVYGHENTINYSRPTEKALEISITLHTFNGYGEAVEQQIAQNIADYINTLNIGESLLVGMLWRCVLSINTDANNPVCVPVEIKAKVSGGSWSTNSVSASYNWMFTFASSDLTITPDN